MNQRRQNKQGVRGVYLLVFMGCLIFTSSVWSFQEDQNLHRLGRRYIRSRKWERAIQTLGMLLNTYPDSHYADDAQFWIGFCYEQIPGKANISLEHYQRVIDAYPESAWADDAVIHQIVLSKTLSEEGDEAARTFLHNKVESSESSIRYQAALALGELKEPSVLPILEEIAVGDDDGLAIQAIGILEGYSDVLEERIKAVPTAESISPVNASPPLDDESKRFYSGLLRQGNLWSEEVLLKNGLYNVAPRGEFDFYLTLENDWDRKEWWRKFWATKDPTPTTPENEAEVEFRRRVIFSWDNFGKDWGKTQFDYPPWDARGELYIKYGSPDHRDRTETPGWEEWTYYKLRTIFRVSDYLTNRMGDAIYLNTVSRYLSSRHRGTMRPQFRRDAQFHFSLPEWEDTKSIEGLRLDVTSAEQEGSQTRVLLTYWIPSKNFRFRLDQDAYVSAYRYRWVLYDEDYHRISSQDSVEEFSRVDKKDLRQGEMTGTIEFRVPGGSYHLGLRIEDIHSNRLGIYRKSFTVRNKGVVEK